METLRPVQALNAEISLEDLRANHKAAWDKAYPHLWGVTLRVVNGTLGPTGEFDIDDLISEVLTGEVIPQVFSPKSESFKRIKNFSDLLNMCAHIAKMRAIDAVRSRVRKPEDVVAAPPEQIQAVRSALAGERDFSWKELMGFIQQVLDPPDPELFHDRFEKGYTTRQIAELRKMPHGTVTSRFASALARLREHIRRIEGLD